MILTKKRLIDASVTGSDECLSLIGIFQIVENMLTEMMGMQNIDGITLKNKYNAFWVFVKTKVHLVNKCAWNEQITLSSFISEISFAKLYADVEAKNSNGDVVFYSRTELCALDISSPKIRRLTTVGFDKKIIAEKAPMNVTFNKVDTNNLEYIEQIKVRSTNIDFSHHTNNVEYVRFILNTYTVNELENKNMKEVTVIYTGQSYENDLLNVFKTNFEDKDIIEIKKDDKTVIKCEIVF